MSEVKVHQFEKDMTYVTGDSKYIAGKRVETGRVLKITHIAAGFDQLGTTEFAELGFWNGHAYIPLKKDNPENAGDLIHWDGEIWLREQQYIYAYLADIGNGEVMRLRAQGKYE